MSLNLLTVPNVYDLFCGSLTIDGPTGPASPVLEGLRTIIPNSPITIQGGPTVATYSIRGAGGSLPAVLPFVQFDVVTNDALSNPMTLVTVHIPQFNVLSMTGSGTPGYVQVTTLPAGLNPVYPITFVVSITNGSSTNVAGAVTIGNGIIAVQPITGNPSTTLFSIANDICITYSLSA